MERTRRYFLFGGAAFFIMDTLEKRKPLIGQRHDLSLVAEIRQSSKDKNVFTFIISTSSQDRHETIVAPGGLNFSHYKNNPVVLFNHDYNKVVGKAFNIRRAGEEIIADMSFADTEAALEVKKLIEGGFLNATSIGFLAKDYAYNEELDSFVITESELLEFSIVAVPSNRDALIMRSNEINSLQESIQKLAQKIDLLVESRNDQSTDQEKPTDDSTANENRETVESDETEDQEPVPDEKEIEEAGENDPSHEDEQPKEEKSANIISLEEAMELARKAVRRRLGKE